MCSDNLSFASRLGKSLKKNLQVSLDSNSINTTMTVVANVDALDPKVLQVSAP